MSMKCMPSTATARYVHAWWASSAPLGFPVVPDV